MLSQKEQALLSAVIDRIMPADDFPSATGFGADAYILKMLDGDAAPVRELIRYGLGELERQGFNCGYNPVLTIMALGMRVGEHIACSL